MVFSNNVIINGNIQNAIEDSEGEIQILNSCIDSKFYTKPLSTTSLILGTSK